MGGPDEEPDESEAVETVRDEEVEELGIGWRATGWPCSMVSKAVKGNERSTYLAREVYELRV